MRKGYRILYGRRLYGKAGSRCFKPHFGKLPRGEKDPNLLVGYDSRDDAAVYQVTEDLALVQTVDFFPPMVDDPYILDRLQRQMR